MLISDFPISIIFYHIIFPAGGQCLHSGSTARGLKKIDRRRMFIYNIVCIHLQEERELI